jgi:hypothetical protein
MVGKMGGFGFVDDHPISTQETLAFEEMVVVRSHKPTH